MSRLALLGTPDTICTRPGSGHYYLGSYLLTVINLALKGFGAPFFIVLSRKLAADWLYAWTRDPMVLAA